MECVMSKAEHKVQKKGSNENTNNRRASMMASEYLQVAAVFDTRANAQDAIDAVSEQTNIALSQVELVESGDPKLSEKLEKGTHGTDLSGACCW